MLKLLDLASTLINVRGIEIWSSLFNSLITTLVKVYKDLKKLWITHLLVCVPWHFLFSQTSSGVSFKQSDYELQIAI